MQSTSYIIYNTHLYINSRKELKSINSETFYLHNFVPTCLIFSSVSFSIFFGVFSEWWNLLLLMPKFLQLVFPPIPSLGLEPGWHQTWLPPCFVLMTRHSRFKMWWLEWGKASLFYQWPTSHSTWIERFICPDLAMSSLKTWGYGQGYACLLHSTVPYENSFYEKSDRLPFSWKTWQ